MGSLWSLALSQMESLERSIVVAGSLVIVKFHARFASTISFRNYIMYTLAGVVMFRSKNVLKKRIYQ